MGHTVGGEVGGGGSGVPLSHEKRSETGVGNKGPFRVLLSDRDLGSSRISGLRALKKCGFLKAAVWCGFFARHRL